MGVFSVARSAAATAVRVVTDADSRLSIYRTTRSGSPTGGDVTESVSSVTVERAAFADNSMARYLQGTLLPGGERVVVVAQKPIRDLGWEIRKGDEVEIVGVKTPGGVPVRSEVLQVVQDPARALWELRVKP